MKRLIAVALLTFAAPAAASDYQVWAGRGTGPWAARGNPAALTSASDRADALRAQGYLCLVLPVGEHPDDGLRKLARHDQPPPPAKSADPKDQPVPVTPVMLDDIVTAIRKVDARVAQIQGDLNTRLTAVEKNVDNLSSQVTRMESRLTAVERGATQPWRAPGELTDPLAAQTAGRVAGRYDGFGQLTQAYPVASGVVGAGVPLAAFPAVPVFQAPASYQISYSSGPMSAGACAGGSCGSGAGGFMSRGPVRRFFSRR